MTEQLITLARTYIEDEAVPYAVTDAIIEQKLNADRKYIESLQIYAEDYSYDNVSCIYKVGYCYLMNMVLNDGTNPIASTNYTVDVENGIITFDASPVVIPDVVYVTFTYHDFYNSIAELWLYMAAKARISGKARLGDEDLPMDKSSREYCIMKYWDYKQSRNIQLER